MKNKMTKKDKFNSEKIENEGITSDEDSNVQTEAEKILEIEEPASEDESKVEETEVAEKTEVAETEEEYSPIILVPAELTPPETEDVVESEKELVSKIVKDCMENVYALKVPLVAELNYGENWYDAK